MQDILANFLMRKMEPHMDCQSRHDDLELRVMKLEKTLANSRFANKVSGAGYRASVTRCCSLKIISIIKENLEKKNLKAFEKSCFGHLLEMNPLRFQGQLMLLLLLNIDIAASNHNTLVFNINNSKMEFGPRDFKFITGLRFGTSEEAAAIATTSSRIHEDVFNGRPAITFKDVEEAFLDVSRDLKGRGELTLKLALLYFLYGVVLPESPNKKIELRYLHLADDLCAFRAFPWGRVGNKFLVSSMLRARHRVDGSSATSLIMPGFIFALQVWAYENMPSLAMHCAARAHNFDSLATLILRWSATNIIRFDHLKHFFTLGVGGHDNEALSAEASPKQKNVKREPSTSSGTHTSIPQEERRGTRSEDVVELLQKDEEAVKEATPTRHSTFSPNPISANKLQSSLTETERTRALFALAFDDNPALHTPQPLWKACSEFEISEAEYERSKVLYEMLLDTTKGLKLWTSYAQFEAFAMIEGSEIRDKRKCLERGRAVFERGLSYFRSCAPKMKEERAMLLEEWFDMEYRFGEVGDVHLVRAKLPQKLKKRRRVEIDDGTARYEEYIEYRFPEEKDVEVLKKHKSYC